jgi:XTP/dITP diphosphohydrolase
MRRLLFATRNAHKTREAREILGPDFEILDLNGFPNHPDVEESGMTFRQNAILKAVSASLIFDDLIFSDDSGIEVDALGGAPGVQSARYAGEPSDDERNREKLLTDLDNAGARGKQRTARFRCVIVAAKGSSVLETFDGVIEGVITNQPKGKGGFGYDPIFIPDGYCRTFAQLPVEIKNLQSHRARALAGLSKWLELNHRHNFA